jgi:prepilin-type N-terminal cleavage/methylation domain-containing protein
MNRYGLTLMEMVIVVVVVGILAAIALPNFTPMRSQTIDREAQASLKLIQAAEKIYRMEASDYYPMVGSGVAEVTDHNLINTNLKLMLPLPAANVYWSYKTMQGGCADARRAIGSGPNWRLRISGTEPTVGLCP